jgi:peptidoglycan/xylan/chitin deacetylase (PgdA/CDA1 family)
VAWDPLGLAVGTPHFAEQLHVLSRSREVVSLAELIRRKHSGKPLERLAALTFDDGYHDFRVNAVPHLAAAGMPATVFVTTGSTGRTFWWEEVSALLTPRAARREPLVIRIREGNERVSFEQLNEDHAAARAARDICHHLRCEERAEIDSTLVQIRRWAEMSEAQIGDGVPLSAEEIVSLSQNGTVEIGAHTVGHSCLGTLDPATQRTEIEQSRTDLEKIMGRPVSGFSYPNGSLSRDTPRILKEADFAYACASLEGTVRRRTDPYVIPRLWVSDMGAGAFERWLANWIRIGG